MSIDTETDLPKRKLGRTGLEVTQLGFGTALRSGPDDVIDDDRVGRILNAVLDAGINFIDTAPDYGDSEERIGDYISHRRDQFYLATKWTKEQKYRAQRGSGNSTQRSQIC